MEPLPARRRISPDVSATDPDYYFGLAPGISLVKKTNGVDSNAAPGQNIPVGSPVTWSYEVKNTGNVVLTNVVVTDDKLGQIGIIPSLAVGQTVTLTKDGIAIEGQYSNMGTAAGKPPIGPDVTATDPDNYFGQKPGISLVKKTNGVDSNAAPGQSILAGDPVTWSYEVKNTGNVVLTNVVVTDDKLGQIGIIPSLAVGQTVTLTKDGIAIEGQYSNMGTAAGKPPIGPDVTATDPDNYFGQKPGISLVKKTNGVDSNAAPGQNIPAGDPVTWSYEVKNTGNVVLTNVVVTDDKLGQIGIIPSLAVGQTVTLAKDGIAIEGQYSNMGTAAGKPPIGPDVTATDPDNYFGQKPGISLVKKTNGVDSNTAPGQNIPVGSPVTWSYEVKNTGNVVLTNVVVTDDKLGQIGIIPSLAVGQTVTLTKDGIAIEGQYSNMGTAAGKPPIGPDVTATDPDNYFGQKPGISLVKKTNGVDSNTAPGQNIPVGNPVTWSYEVKNTGNVVLTNVVVTDDKLGQIGIIPSLAVGQTVTLTKDGIAIEGQYSNMGTAAGKPPIGPDVTATDPDNYFGQKPGISLVKKTNGVDSNTAPGQNIPVGSPVTWSYEVKNTGNVVLTNVVVTDDKLGQIGIIPSLAVGQTVTLTKDGIAIEGQYSNMGTAAGKPPIGPDVTATDPDNYFGQNPGISLVKKTNGVDSNTAPGQNIPVGNPVTWSYEVKNTGNVVLTNVVVTDDKLGQIGTIASLAVGETETLTTLPGPTAVTGQYSNNATATGKTPSGRKSRTQIPTTTSAWPPASRLSRGPMASIPMPPPAKTFRWAVRSPGAMRSRIPATWF